MELRIQLQAEKRMLDSFEEIPIYSNGPFVYCIYSKSGELIYVGWSRFLHARVGSHLAKWRYEIASIKVKSCKSEDEATDLERDLIRRHKPRYNISEHPEKVVASKFRRIYGVTPNELTRLTGYSSMITRRYLTGEHIQPTIHKEITKCLKANKISIKSNT